MADVCGGIQWHVVSKATYHIAGCKNSIRHLENRFSPYFIFLFLMQFRLRRAAAFVSSPIHLYDLLYYYPYFLFSSSYLTSLLSPVQATPSVIRWNCTTWRAAARGTRRPTTNRQRSTMQCDSCRRGGVQPPVIWPTPQLSHRNIPWGSVPTPYRLSSPVRQ